MNLGIETENLEFKKTTGELNEACVSISAILNKHGVGTLFFGVRKNGDVVGQNVSESSLRDVSRKVAEQIKPNIYPVITKENLDGKSVIKVEFNGYEKPYSAGGKYYIRVADEDKAVTPTNLKKMFIENASFKQWETTLTEYTNKDIDRTALKRFVDNAKRAGRLPSNARADLALLRQLGLLVENNLNNAGALLFSKRKPLKTNMAIFATDEKLTFLDIAPAEDNIINLIDIAERYVMKNLRWKAEIVGMEREETPEIPTEAIRESIANSFAHAVYISNTYHEICIHPNLVTIYNPGAYASKHKPEEYVHKNFSSSIRNELIAKTLYLNKSIEQFGSGFKRIDELCKDAGVKYTYEDHEDGFKFIFHRVGDMNVTNNVTNYDALTPTEKVVYQLICQNPNIKRSEIASKISKTPRTVQRVFDSLREKGYIEREGSTRFGYWIIK